MINENRALVRQLRHYFEGKLFGLYRWQDVLLRHPEPVKIERDPRGRRINERSLGRFVEEQVIEFDGYTLTLRSPNETEPPAPVHGQERLPPLPAVLLYDGPPQPDNLVVSGPNASATWDQITKLLADNLKQGTTDGGSQRSAGR
jgi:hypothetical protein